MNETEKLDEKDKNWQAPETSPEEELDEDGLTAEQRAMADHWVPINEARGNATIEKRDARLEIEQFKDMLELYRAKYNLEELRAITYQDLTVLKDGSRIHNVSDRARRDLIPLTESLKVLEDETDITKEQYIELHDRYLKISKAVGMIDFDTRILKH